MIRAGSLRHMVVIQENTESSDGLGPGGQDSWGTVSGQGAVPAAIWALKATERFELANQQLTATHRIRIRYRSGITEKMRIAFGSEYYYIVEILNKDERNIYLDILTEKRT